MESFRSRHHRGKKPETARPRQDQQQRPAGKTAADQLEIVLKCDTAGTEAAVAAAIQAMPSAGPPIRIMRAGVGAINKSDVLMAETGSRLVVGFNVGVSQGVEPLLAQHGVEIRLYQIIYRLTEDLLGITASLLPRVAEERITGTAGVIALFKSSRHGIILGCEVREGRLAAGESFRLISAMGPVYSGRIESLQIERTPVRIATPGQQVGLKISDFNQARVGDLVECYQTASRKEQSAWQPRPGILHL